MRKFSSLRSAAALAAAAALFIGPSARAQDGGALARSFASLQARIRTRPLRLAAPEDVFSHLSPAQKSALAASLPGRAQSEDKRPSVPLNLVFLGSAAQIRAGLAVAGWSQAPLSIYASLSESLDQLMNRQWPRIDFPPFKTFYVEGRPEDFNWVMVIRMLFKRHHFRLWDMRRQDAFGREIWSGGGNLDVSVDWEKVTHRVDPDIDAERAFLAKTLAASGVQVRLSVAPSPNVPRRGKDSDGFPFYTDGSVLIVEFPPYPFVSAPR
ncbi:MAG TPA: LssY C-terminal domain-containing protein [Elusimicrobiota bacterium]|nr:LssY C-terminal domain-containing protein [Elusimicrobiota bacterium]